MSKIPFSNPLGFIGKKSSSNQAPTIVDTVVSELLETPPQSSVDTPTAPIGVQNAVRPSGKFICEACPSDVAKSHGSPTTLAYHVRDNHPSEWPFQLIIPKSKTYAKKWKAGQVKVVVDTYVQLRATQNVGRRFVADRIKTTSGELRVRNAYWVDCSVNQDTSNSSHVKALNAASMAVGRNTKSVRDVLNATLALTKGMVKHQPILVRQIGGKGPQCELTTYGLKRIKQIRDKCGYVGSGGIEGLKELANQSTTVVQDLPQSDPIVETDAIVGDPTVMQPRETQETEVDNLVWKAEPSNIVSTWAGLTQGVLKYVSELQQQVSDLKNLDQNRIDQRKEIESKDQTITQKDQIIASQKERIVQLNKKGDVGKERDDLKIQVQNLTEDRDALLLANGKLVNQAKAHNKEKQDATLAKKADVSSLENRMTTLMQDLENMKKNLE